MPQLVLPVAKSYRSPLRYPGGKQRAAKTIADILENESFMPSGARIASPFFGGGSVELELAARGHTIIGSDFFAPVAAFWQQLKRDPYRLHDKCLQDWCEPPSISKKAFYNLQDEVRQLLTKCPIPKQGDGQVSLEFCFRLAWRFFVLNRKSFSGATLSGGMASGDRFNRAAIDRLLFVNSDQITVKHGDYWEQLFCRRKRRFTFDAIYADPPYALQASKLYGDKGSTHDEFDHARFARHMNRLSAKHDIPILISYNDCDLVRELFKGWHFQSIAWAYGMNASKKSNEILIRNF